MMNDFTSLYSSPSYFKCLPPLIILSFPTYFTSILTPTTIDLPLTSFYRNVNSVAPTHTIGSIVPLDLNDIHRSDRLREEGIEMEVDNEGGAMPLLIEEHVTVWSIVRGALSGTASGVMKLLVGHPFDTVRMQTEGGHGRFIGMLDCVKQTFKNEGIRGFYKGATPPLFGWGIIDSIMWGSLIQYRKLLQTDPLISLTIPQHFVAGALAGLTTVPVVTPLEQVKARLQIQYHDPTSKKYTGPIDCVTQLVRNNGLKGLYYGVAGTILFRVQMGFYFAGYEYFRTVLSPYHDYLGDIGTNFISGGMAANILWCIAFPSDSIKNKMAGQPDVYPRRYPTVRSCITDIYTREGFRGFYRGFLPCMMRSFPTNGAAFVAAELMLKALPQH